MPLTTSPTKSTLTMGIWLEASAAYAEDTAALWEV